MTIWACKNVDENPEVTMTSWKIVESKYTGDTTSRNIVGRNIDEGDGRVSSDILSFDAKTMTCITTRGRKYKLLGPSGVDRDASYVWGRWAEINHVVSSREVSDEYCRV